MRTPVIAGNWKMNLGLQEAVDLARGLRTAATLLEGVEVGVAPPFPYMAAIHAELEGSPLWMAGQDCHWDSAGAFTGDVAALMLRDLGCTHVILGHSERRHGWGESPETVGRKVKTALETGLIPIVCVGEKLDERRGDRTRDVVLGQLEAALDGLTSEELQAMIVAYEPVWAIGTGENATPEQAGSVHGLIREWLGVRFSTSHAESVRILYGGSVKPDNAAELLAVDGVDGALVGGASLEGESFLGIVRAASA